jgi:hypothetical protein
VDTVDKITASNRISNLILRNTAEIDQIVDRASKPFLWTEKEINKQLYGLKWELEKIANLQLNGVLAHRCYCPTPEDFGYVTRVWIFPASFTDEKVNERLRNLGVSLEGYDYPPSAYDCTGEWAASAVEIRRTKWGVIATQNYSQDI